MSAGLPRGAPPSAHFAILAISSSLREGSCLNFWIPMFKHDPSLSEEEKEGSCLNFWIPMFRSTKNGGIAPLWLRRAVRVFMALAQGLTSSYVTSDIGATPSA